MGESDARPEHWPPGPEDEIKMMRNPNRWPAWPKLPLKRSFDYENPRPHLGFLQEERMGEPIKPKVYLGTIFERSGTLESVEYETWASLLADGWVVD